VKSSTELYRSTALEKKGSWRNPQLDGCLIRRFVPSFSSTIANEAVRKRQALVDNQLLGLPGSYHRHEIDTFNTYSQGPTHQSLTDTSNGYNLEGVNLSHTTSRPSQLTISTFHLRALPDLQFNHKPSIKPKFKFNEPMVFTWSSNHSVIYRSLHICLAIANDLFVAIGPTKIDRKII
jgi:hypothetical protein